MPKAALVLAAVVATIGLASCAFVKVGAPSGVTLDGVTLNGSVGSGFEWDGEWWFAYGPTGALEEETPRVHVSVSPGGRQPVTAAIDGLDRATAYFYRLCIDDDADRAPQVCSHEHVVHTGDTVGVDDHSVFWNDQVDGFAAHLTIDASSGPFGEEPAGRVDFEYSFPDDRADRKGPVTCLAVDGQRATIGVDGEGGDDFVLLVVVTGSVAEGRNTRIGIFPAPADPAVCPAPVALGQPEPWIVAGPAAEIVDGP